MITNNEIFRKYQAGNGAIDLDVVAPAGRVLVTREIRLTTQSDVSLSETLDVNIEHSDSALVSIIRKESLTGGGGPSGAVGITDALLVARGDTLNIAWTNAGAISYLLEVFYELAN